jgi:deoxyhypusine synthase
MGKGVRSLGPVTKYIEHHYRHFNSATLIDASRAYGKHCDNGDAMMVCLAGAMSTAELGLSLAEMIRKGKVHAISCTGANLEEDVYNLVAHDEYCRIPNWRSLSAKDETKLYKQGFNRVTDTCIPEEAAMRKIERLMWKEWELADKKGESNPPHVYFWRLFEKKEFRKSFQIDSKSSWLFAAWEHNIPIFTPGWEDSTLANMFAAACISGKVSTPRIMNSGIQTMMRLAEWYTKTSKSQSIGMFQIGGGIAGDFPICVVPMLHQDLKRKVRRWGYFCQISDSTTSYGSYSGAVPNEKITWGKLEETTPMFMIESDATIVAPLVFAHVLNW